MAKSTYLKPAPRLYKGLLSLIKLLAASQLIGCQVTYFQVLSTVTR